MYSYAQIDKDTKICFGVSHLSGEVNKDNLIPLESGATDALGKRWNGASWEEVEQEPTDEAAPEPTNTELQELLLTLMDGMVDLYEATDTEVAE